MVCLLSCCGDSEMEPICDPWCFIPGLRHPIQLYVTEGLTTTFVVGLAPGETSAHLQTIYPKGTVVLDPHGLSLSLATPVQTYTLTALPDDDAMNYQGFIELHYPGTIAGESPRTRITVVDTDATSVVASNWNLVISAPGMATFDVRLTRPPTEAIEVTLQVLCNCLGMIPVDPASIELSAASLTFTPENYDEAQTVTVRRLADVDASIELVPTGGLFKAAVLVQGPYSAQ